MLLPVHIAAGLVALSAGAVALSAAKGSRLHRRSGTVFFAAMLVLTFTGWLIDALRDAPLSVPALLTGYLVLTGWLTLRDDSPQVRRAHVAMLLFAVAIAIGAAYAGPELVRSGQRPVGIATMVFGGVAALAAWGDLQVVRHGPRAGRLRLARHLWRMGVAMWIATMSFFLGQAKVIPEPVRIPALLSLPVLLVLGAVVYWLVRVLRGPAASTRSAT